MRLLSVFMSRTKSGSKSSSEVLRLSFLKAVLTHFAKVCLLNVYCNTVMLTASTEKNSQTCLFVKAPLKYPKKVLALHTKSLHGQCFFISSWIFKTKLLVHCTTCQVHHLSFFLSFFQSSSLISNATATALLSLGAIDYCLHVLKSLLEFWKSQQGEEEPVATSQLLRPHTASSPPDMSPFFLRQYVKVSDNRKFLS